MNITDPILPNETQIKMHVEREKQNQNFITYPKTVPKGLKVSEKSSCQLIFFEIKTIFTPKLRQTNSLRSKGNEGRRRCGSFII